MLKELHIASQYLAAAGISFVEAKQDDSHTNLGWSMEHKSLFTRSLNNHGLVLALNYKEFSLQWINKDWQVLEQFSLSGLTHGEIYNRLSDFLKAHSIEGKYNYQFHYDLPYEKMIDAYRFPQVDNDEVSRVSTLTSTAQQAFEKLNEQLEEKVEIRVWPHHFDLGLFAKVNEQLSVGVGLAIPDGMVNDHYYYVTGWDEGGSMSTEGFGGLDKGEWKSGNFNGAILSASGTEVSTIDHFLIESINHFKRKLN